MISTCYLGACELGAIFCEASGITCCFFNIIYLAFAQNRRDSIEDIFTMNDGKKSSLAKNPVYHITKDPERTYKRLKFSLRKERATICYKDGHADVECLFTLIDLSENGTGVFTSNLLPKGALVMIRVDSPMKLMVPGMVVWSVPVSSGIANRKFPYRSGILFQFEKEEEKQSVRSFLERASDGNWKVDPPPAVNPDPIATPAPTTTGVPEGALTAPAVVSPETPAAANTPIAPVENAPLATPVSAPAPIRPPGLDGAVVANVPTADPVTTTQSEDPDKKAA